MNKQLLTEFCLTQSITLTEEQIEAFENFEKALYEANDKMNLTRIIQNDCTVRHFLESLLIVDKIKQDATVLDIGTGPGFPAWPLACARPDIKVRALDSNKKMCEFLLSQKLPKLTVANIRAEDFKKRENFDFVTGRAVAPLEIQMELCAAFCKVGGLVMPYRTPNDKEKIQKQDFGQLGLKLEEVIERSLPTTDIIRIFPIYRKIGVTPKKYPRLWTIIKNKPLK